MICVHVIIINIINMSYGITKYWSTFVMLRRNAKAEGTWLLLS